MTIVIIFITDYYQLTDYLTPLFPEMKYTADHHCRYDEVQALVEKPYLHLIARSNSSAEHQLKYVNERIAELKSLHQPFQYEGRRYNTIVRYNSG